MNCLRPIRDEGKNLVRHQGSESLPHGRDPLFDAGRTEDDADEPGGRGDLAKVLEEDGLFQAGEDGHGLGHEFDGGRQDDAGLGALGDFLDELVVLALKLEENFSTR